MKKVVNINEMIEVVKEKTGWSEAILAIDLEEEQFQEVKIIRD